MHASPESHSGEDAANPGPSNVLIVGPNWLGDSIMAMPAIQAYRRAFPGRRITILTKPYLADMWTMHAAIDETWSCMQTIPAILEAVARIRRQRFEAAFIIPQSFRSALFPFLGGIPRRRGLRGHARSLFLTEIVTLPDDAATIHQQRECMCIMNRNADQDELPLLRINDILIEKARTVAGHSSERLVGLLPGAARGSAKRWPADHFALLGRMLCRDHNCRLALFGSAADRETCALIGEKIGGNVLNLAGQTSLTELAAFLSQCAAVVGNDSGGIHLAAAAGTPVVAIFGFTDPVKTKPLGRRVVILQEAQTRARDIPHRSAPAEASLKKISPEKAAEAVCGLIGG